MGYRAASMQPSGAAVDPEFQIFQSPPPRIRHIRDRNMLYIWDRNMPYYGAAGDPEFAIFGYPPPPLILQIMDRSIPY